MPGFDGTGPGGVGPMTGRGGGYCIRHVSAGTPEWGIGVKRRAARGLRHCCELASNTLWGGLAPGSGRSGFGGRRGMARRLEGPANQNGR